MAPWRSWRPWRAWSWSLLCVFSAADVEELLAADDECVESCALSALQKRQPWQPWLYPWSQVPTQPTQPTQPTPWMVPQPHGQLHPPMPYWMQPMQPPPSPMQMPPQTVQPVQNAVTTAEGRKRSYVPLSSTGWGLIADEEGQELARLTTSQHGCEDACDATNGCHSFVFCTFGGCYLKSAKFQTGSEPMHYSGFCSTFWAPQAALPPLQHVEVRQCAKGTVPEASGSCTKSNEPKLMTFYQYRAQSGVIPKGRVWENMNLADLGGVMFYLHNEVVDKDGEMRDASGACTTKFQVDRIMRFKVTMKNSQALWKKFRSQFGQFIQFDYGQATFGMPNHVEKCNAIWKEFGYEVGCQANPIGISGYDDGYWTSWPGRCPSMPFTEKAPQGGPAKTQTCMKEQPGGSCGSPDGSLNCIWHVEEAGFVMLDDLVGQDVAKLYKGGGWQYEKSSDQGKGMSFWNGKKDKQRCKERQEKLLNLFAQKYRDLPASLTDPRCDFWR